MEPFYFKSYDKVVGVAHNTEELKDEMKRIYAKDPACVEYHLKEGHIVSWLNYMGEKGLAEILRGVTDVREAISRIDEYKALKNMNKTQGKKKKVVRYYY